ncbi:hypothetical protein [Brunnivagina elsteri]|nr:hypothetical protein [Calothrix elsteri]
MFWNEGQLIHNSKYRIERYLGGGGFAASKNLGKPSKVHGVTLSNLF